MTQPDYAIPENPRRVLDYLRLPGRSSIGATDIEVARAFSWDIGRARDAFAALDSLGLLEPRHGKAQKRKAK